MACLCLGLRAAEAAGPAAVRVRVEWGGGAAKTWEGTISLGQGTLSDPRPLGIEADEPGSMWIKDNVLLIQQRSPRSYDGVDLSVAAPADQQLIIQLTPLGERPGGVVRLPLSDLLAEPRGTNLDSQGNRLMVRRAPGDRLPVTVKHRSLVFSTGDVLKLEIQPHLLGMSADAKVRIALSLTEAHGGGALWSGEHTARAEESEPVVVNVPLPKQEGVYDVNITALPTGWQHAVRVPLMSKPIAERRVQVLVLGSRPSAAPVGPGGELSTVVEIDPTNPRWGERLAKLPQLAQLPRLRRGPLGNGNARVQQTPLGPATELSPNRPGGDPSWEAYTLPVNRPGVPHVLEVEYPGDASQSLGISVMEPNAAGAIMPIGLDSGVESSGQWKAGGSGPRWERHRLIFWPRTRAPLVLLTNQSDRTPAVYGKIRVLGGWEQLPRAFPPGLAPQRLMAAYLDRPLFPENFSASEALDAYSGRSLDDWVPYYQRGTRLFDYLHHAGFDGLQISVLADGSTIYPSAVLEPTPRYDTGVFFDSAQDPVRKDGLEMLLRLFDREKMQLIAALEFAAPLPRLEELRRGPSPQSDGIEWVGPEGSTWCQVNATRRGMAPYYNVLDPRVQEAMLAVVRELVANYAQHPSFAAMALQLSADGYAQLPGPEWGLDDVTIGRFERETNLKVPGEGPNRFHQRAHFLAAEANRRVWLQWRAEQMHRFYRQVYSELCAARPDARLYLTGANLFTGSEMQYELRPTLPRRATFAEALLQVGLDVRHYQGDDIILLRCDQVAPIGRLPSHAVALEVRQMPDFEQFFGSLPLPGSLFFHAPQQLRIPSFDQQSPFRPTYTELMTQLAPSDRQNRRRFVHSLATSDPRLMIDGGWLLPLGQESSLLDLVEVYRRLPAARFERVAESGHDSSQPVTIRTCTQGDRTFAYVVNDAPFAVALRVGVEASADCRIEEITGARKVPPLELAENGAAWSINLKPYDLVGVWLPMPHVRFTQARVRPIEGASEELAQRIRTLGVRAAMLAEPPEMNVLQNPGFEASGSGGDAPPGWLLAKQSGVQAKADSSEKHAGGQSLRLASEGANARLTSQSFAAPATGRVAMSVWLRVSDPQRQPPLRLALEGKLDGSPYYRYAPLGAAQSGSSAVPLGSQWAQYIFQVDDLPLEGLTDVRVRFDLIGQGEVWIDDVQLFNLRFSKMERIELAKLISLADVKLQNGQIGDCLRLLDGYWPRFLEANVTLPDSANPQLVAQRPANKSAAAEKADAEPAARPEEQPGWLDRMKNMLPRPLRF